MKSMLVIGTLMLALAAAPFALAQEDAAPAVELKVGDTAPDFSLVGTDGNPYTLSQFKGEKNVALAFFPKAFTPG